jgi:Coenzyme PQQ synthesis protein D (PqqD)
MQLKQDGVSWHLVGDDIVVLDLNGSMYLKLSGSGRVLWERLAEPAEEADLSAALVETYGIDTDRAATDVAAFVAALRRRDLLVE